MTEGDVGTAFTWRDFQAQGFTELRALLGAGWELIPRVDDAEVAVHFDGAPVGTLLAIDPFDIERHLGPSECLYIDPERYDESCLSLTLEGNLFPTDSNPANLASAAAAFRRSAKPAD